MELQKEPTFGNAGLNINRCWQNATLQALRCSPTFKKMIATEFPDPGHILNRVFVQRPPEGQFGEAALNSNYGAQGTAKLTQAESMNPFAYLATMVKPGARMTLVAELEVYLRDLVHLMLAHGYDFDDRFLSFIEKKGFQVAMGDGALPDTLIYLFAILFNDTISFTSSWPRETWINEISCMSASLGSYKKRSVHFHKRKDQSEIPPNCVAIINLIAVNGLSSDSELLRLSTWTFSLQNIILGGYQSIAWWMSESVKIQQTMSLMGTQFIQAYLAFGGHAVCYCHDLTKDVWYDNNTFSNNANTDQVHSEELKHLFDMTSQEIMRGRVSPPTIWFTEPSLSDRVKETVTQSAKVIADRVSRLNRMTADIFVTDTKETLAKYKAPQPFVDTKPGDGFLYDLSYASQVWFENGDLISEQDGTYFLNGTPRQFIHLLREYANEPTRKSIHIQGNIG